MLYFRSMRVPRTLWEAAGRPSTGKGEPTATTEPCYWCGYRCQLAYPTAKICGTTFTDHDEAAEPASPWTCAACAWSMSGRPPKTLRTYSMVYRADGDFRPREGDPPAFDLDPQIHLCGRDDLSEVERVLTDPPAGDWACAVSLSGKIHVVPHAVLNRGPGPWRVRVERWDVASNPETLRDVLARCRDLYAAGFSRVEIRSGSPTLERLYRSFEVWERHIVALAPYRRGALIALAVTLLRKEDR